MSDISSKSRSGFLITQVKQLGSRVFDKFLARDGVKEFNGAQGRILYVLWELEASTMTELAKKTGLARNTLTSMLDRMDAAGLTTRVSDDIDRRVTRISLTENAKKLKGDYDKVSDEMNELYFKGFSDEEIKRFEGYLLRILGNLEKEIK